MGIINASPTSIADMVSECPLAVMMVSAMVVFAVLFIGIFVGNHLASSSSYSGVLACWRPLNASSRRETSQLQSLASHFGIDLQIGNDREIYKLLSVAS